MINNKLILSSGMLAIICSSIGGLTYTGIPSIFLKSYFLCTMMVLGLNSTFKLVERYYTLNNNTPYNWLTGVINASAIIYIILNTLFLIQC